MNVHGGSYLLGALVALFLILVLSPFVHAGEYDWNFQGVTERMLVIDVYGTSKKDPTLHRVYEQRQPYDSRHTCEAALEDQLDLKFIQQAVQFRLGKKVMVLRAHASCVDAAPII